jgi:hypothetical protein
MLFVEKTEQAGGMVTNAGGMETQQGCCGRSPLGILGTTRGVRSRRHNSGGRSGVGPDYGGPCKPC